MKRKLLRILAVLVALVAILLLSCLDGVDYRPYFRQPYYTNTLSRLALSAATNTLARGELEAGFGRALLTPTVNAAQDDPARGQFKALPLAGFGNRKGHPASGVHDDLYVKAVALRVGNRLGVMVGVDALIIPPEVTEIVVKRLEPELHREQLYLSATHTHCGMGGWGEGKIAEEFAGPFTPGARAWFAERIAAAVHDAIADLKPALLGHGSFSAPDFVRNRVVGSAGQTDPEFSYLFLKQTNGQSAVLGSYAAHATILSAKMMEFSADYPGVWERAVEKATGGTAVFLAGSVGSHAPNPGESGLNGVEKMGQALADRLLERLPHTALTNSITFDMLALDVSMPPLGPRLSDGIRLRPWLAARLLHPPPYSFLQCFRLDDSLWVSTPCDFSGELALGIKNSLRQRGFNAAITSFNGDYVGYVILPRYYHLDGYEPRLMSFFGPYVPDYFDDLIRRMTSELAKQ